VLSLFGGILLCRQQTRNNRMKVLSDRSLVCMTKRIGPRTLTREDTLVTRFVYPQHTQTYAIAQFPGLIQAIKKKLLV
jgi:hypothetical protein